MTARFPTTRLRRNRLTDAVRDLVAETDLRPSQLILPLFVCERKSHAQKIKSMPTVRRYGLDQLEGVLKKAEALGINSVALFPHVAPENKDDLGSESVNPRGVVPRALEMIRHKFPDIVTIADVALDPYTSHGQDGIVDASGRVMNDLTVASLCQQAGVLARAGAHVLAPSDMMDGRIGAIRRDLEQAGFADTLILSYAAKYASALYGPFRDAVGSSAALKRQNKKDYQMDPRNIKEALREASLDISEGADILLVKPAAFYLDVIHKITTRFEDVPVFAYQVSGEYQMIHRASGDCAELRKNLILESLTCIKRAGARAVITYFALEAAEFLNERA